MGNRAVITTPDKKIGVYLHWNGGRDSVEGFLQTCKKYGFRPPERDLMKNLTAITETTAYIS